MKKLIARIVLVHIIFSVIALLSGIMINLWGWPVDYIKALATYNVMALVISIILVLGRFVLKL